MKESVGGHPGEQEDLAEVQVLLDQRGIGVTRESTGALRIACDLEISRLIASGLRAEGDAAASAEFEETGGLVGARGMDWSRVKRSIRRALYPGLICLDVDGTLVDNTASLLATIQGALQEFTGRSFSVTEILSARRAAGRIGDEEFVAGLCRRHGCGVSPDVAEKAMDELYLGNSQGEGFASMDRLIIDTNFLSRLTKRFSLAFVTNRTRCQMSPLLSRLGLTGDVIVICRDDVKASKPDPEGIRSAMRAARQQDAWMIGDREDDVAAALLVGAIPIGVGPSATQLEAAGAALVLSDVNQLERLLPPVH